MIDHINGDSVDDRICNLREVSRTQNIWNSRYKKNKPKKNKKWCPVGVRKTKHGKYQARITVNKIQHSLGLYNTIEEAFEVYKKERARVCGEYAPEWVKC